MPELARKISFVPSSQTLASSSSQTLRLQSLLPGDAGFLYIETNQSYLQYSFKLGGTSAEDRDAALAHYKNEDVKDKVTDCIAALLHLEAAGSRLPETLVVNIDKASTLTCHLHKPGKPARYWEWTKDDQTLEMSGVKMKFDFALACEERENETIA